MNRMTLLFHGYGGTPDEFAAQVAPALCSDRNVQSLSTHSRALLTRHGYQWFAFTSDDGANRARADKCAAKLEGSIQAMIGAGAVDLIGFSQGAMVALALALRGRLKIGRVVCLSGDFGIGLTEPVFAERVAIAIAERDRFMARHLPVSDEVTQNGGLVRRFRLKNAGHDIGAPALAWLKNEIRSPAVERTDAWTYVAG
jgi:predicted esterase